MRFVSMGMVKILEICFHRHLMVINLIYRAEDLWASGEREIYLGWCVNGFRSSGGRQGEVGTIHKFHLFSLC